MKLDLSKYPPLSITPEIERHIKTGAVIAIGISGGKDSSALAIALNAWLDLVGHPREKRVLVHADLGLIEWKETDEWVRLLAQAVELPLVVVRRAAGDMIDRWETRWRNNRQRYENLECVTLITPWSTPKMRFCTSELKVDPITAELKRRFPKQCVLSASGIRKEESAKRAKAPIAKLQCKLVLKCGNTGFDWHPILDWTIQDVFALHKETGFPLHPAYTVYGSSRLSCSFCILAAACDHTAALRHPHNLAAFNRLVELELNSAFSFQDNAWLAERGIQFLNAELRERLVQAKSINRQRRALEAQLPDSVLYEAGWPVRRPTAHESELLAKVRNQVVQLMGFTSPYLEPHSIIARYDELLEIKQQKAKNKKTNTHGDLAAA